MSATVWEVRCAFPLKLHHSLTLVRARSKVHKAPRPEDIVWNNLIINRRERTVRSIIVGVALL